MINFYSLFQKVNEISKDITDWRRKFRQYPEVGFDLEKSSSLVANLLIRRGAIICFFTEA